jgi:hypothetical protein
MDILSLCNVGILTGAHISDSSGKPILKSTTARTPTLTDAVFRELIDSLFDAVMVRRVFGIMGNFARSAAGRFAR